MFGSFGLESTVAVVSLARPIGTTAILLEDFHVFRLHVFGFLLAAVLTFPPTFPPSVALARGAIRNLLVPHVVIRLKNMAAWSFW